MERVRRNPRYISPAECFANVEDVVADQGHSDDDVWQERSGFDDCDGGEVVRTGREQGNEMIAIPRCFFSVAVADSTPGGRDTGAIRMYYACEMARFPRNHWCRAAPG